MEFCSLCDVIVWVSNVQVVIALLDCLSVVRDESRIGHITKLPDWLFFLKPVIDILLARREKIEFDLLEFSATRYEKIQNFSSLLVLLPEDPSEQTVSIHLTSDANTKNNNIYLEECTFGNVITVLWKVGRSCITPLPNSTKKHFKVEKSFSLQQNFTN